LSPPIDHGAGPNGVRWRAFNAVLSCAHRAEGGLSAPWDELFGRRKLRGEDGERASYRFAFRRYVSTAQSPANDRWLRLCETLDPARHTTILNSDAPSRKSEARRERDFARALLATRRVGLGASHTALKTGTLVARDEDDAACVKYKRGHRKPCL